MNEFKAETGFIGRMIKKLEREALGWPKWKLDALSPEAREGVERLRRKLRRKRA